MDNAHKKMATLAFETIHACSTQNRPKYFSCSLVMQEFNGKYLVEIS